MFSFIVNEFYDPFKCTLGEWLWWCWWSSTMSGGRARNGVWSFLKTTKASTHINLLVNLIPFHYPVEFKPFLNEIGWLPKSFISFNVTTLKFTIYVLATSWVRCVLLVGSVHKYYVSNTKTELLPTDRRKFENLGTHTVLVFPLLFWVCLSQNVSQSSQFILLRTCTKFKYIYT